GQVYRPETFNPPVIPALNNVYKGEDLMYDAGNGRKVLRPCGLTDTPGGACSAGTIVALLGLSGALRPIGSWKRLGALVLAFLGVVVIYYTFVRAMLVMLIASLAVLALLLYLQRFYVRATMLLAVSAAMVGGAMLWAIRTIGTGVLDRFALL